MRGLVCAKSSIAAAEAAASLQEFLASGFRRVHVDHASSLDAVMTGEPPDLLLLFSCPEEIDELLRALPKLRLASPGCVTLVIADGLTQETIGALFAAGVRDFMGTASTPAELLARVQHALGNADVSTPAEIRSLVHSKVKGIIGTSPVFLRELAKLPVLAGCDAGVLVLGETGTGKEIFAQAVHYSSARSSRPWVAVNCGAIPAELMENELFGHTRGAYTGAHAPQSGLVREAEGGTLFLDEIDSLPYEAQAKLLRFVQAKEYRPVGCSTTLVANVRIIAASNQSLESRVEAGKFRRDLFYRLNVLSLTLPPLRERREDIPALALHFLRQFAVQHRRHITGLAARATAHLLERDWPGNVRELQHVIERAVLMAQGPLLALGDFEQRAETTDVAESFRRSKQRVVENFERNYLEHLLTVNSGNITSAAKAAKKNRRALFELIRKHNIDPGQFRAGAQR